MNNKVFLSLIVLGLMGGSLSSNAMLNPTVPANATATTSMNNNVSAPTPMVVTSTPTTVDPKKAGWISNPFGTITAKAPVTGSESGSFQHCSGWIQAKLGESGTLSAKSKLTKVDCVKVFTDSTNNELKSALSAERTATTADDNIIPSACQFGQKFWGGKHINSLGYTIANMCKSSAKAARKAQDQFESNDKNHSLPAVQTQANGNQVVPTVMTNTNQNNGNQAGLPVAPKPPVMNNVNNGVVATKPLTITTTPPTKQPLQY